MSSQPRSRPAILVLRPRLLKWAIACVAALLWSPSWSAAHVYEPGYGAVPFYTFEEEPLNDRMGLRVNVRSGNLLFTASDVQVKGTGIDLSLERYYNSLAGHSDQIGYGWRQSLSDDVTLTFDANGDAEYRAPTGFVAPFVKQPDGAFKAPLGLNVELTQASNGDWLLTYNGSQTSMRFPAAGGDVELIEDKNGNTIDPVYSGPDNEVGTVVDSQGRTTTFAYDNDDRLEKITDPGAREFEYGYTGENLTSYTDPSDEVTYYAYDSDHNLTKITDPEGNETRLTYDSSARVTSFTRVTDPSTGAGETTSFDYDTGDSRCPSGTESTDVTDPRGKVTVYCTDNERRAVKVIDAAGNERDTAYDADSNVSMFTAGAFVQQATWASGGRLSTAESPTGGMTSFTYGDTTHEFFPTAVQNARGNSTSFAYQDNNLTQVTDAEQKVTNLAYNADGTLASSITPKGAGLADPNPYKTTYEYDTAGNLTKINHPAPLGAETLTYDTLSRVASITDGKGQKRSFTYDPLDRVTKISYRKTDQLVEAEIDLAYDANGNLTSRTDPTGTRTLSYDHANRVLQESLPLSRTNSYSYDAAGNLTTFEDAGGEVTYAYDDVNQLTELTEPDDDSTTFQYNREGSRTQTVYPGGVTIDQTYDDGERLESISNKAPNGSVIRSFAYTYGEPATGDDYDLRTKVVEEDGDATTYSYDANDRLTGAETKNSGGTVTKKFVWAYDANGNRTSQTVDSGTPTTYDYNAANEMTRAGTANVTYDANGNELAKGSQRSQAYNARNQTIEIDSGSGTTDFTYEGPGQSAVFSDRSDVTFSHSALGLSYRKSNTSSYYFTRDNQGKLVVPIQGGQGPAGMSEGAA